MRSQLSRQIAVAIITATAFGLAAAVESRAAANTAQDEARHAARLVADLFPDAPFDHYPNRDQNHANESEPLPAQF